MGRKEIQNQKNSPPLKNARVGHPDCRMLALWEYHTMVAELQDAAPASQACLSQAGTPSQIPTHSQNGTLEIY